MAKTPDLFPQTDATTPEPPASFEKLVDQLDKLVAQLESGQLSLEDSLAAFDSGMAISRKAAGILDAAEHRLEQIAGSPDKPELRPLDEPA
jgi:exodeoxyribonuclease VII small subunit